MTNHFTARCRAMLSVVGLLTLATGCPAAGPSAADAGMYAPPAPVPVDVGMEPGHGTGVLPGETTAADTRSRRRMDLDQLNATIRTVTGGVGWTEMRGSREVDLLVELSATLGKPDFVEITTEDLEPSPIFLKFLDDAARSICDVMIKRETTEGSEAPRVLFVDAAPADSWERNPTAVQRNLSSLLLRFHGRHVVPGSPEMQSWTWMVQSVNHVNPDPVEAWRTVCVALFTHPDFYTY